MWGNKDAFLKAGRKPATDIGSGDDQDWNKVVIMGKQICPDERLFTEGHDRRRAASTSTSKPATRRSTSHSTMRRLPTWRAAAAI